jgi:dUTP pyrophosphatase
MKEVISLNFKKLNDLAKTPTRGSQYSAGWDLYAATKDEIWILPHETVKIGTGIAVELPSLTFGAIYARSGLATKQGLRPANCCGIVDEDYRGELIVALHNDTDIPQMIPASGRIAQFIVQNYVPITWHEVDELTDTERGEKGFGSSGVK